MTLPPEVALQTGKIMFREGDHQLMSGIFVGQVHPPQGDPANVFTVANVVPGEEADGPVERDRLQDDLADGLRTSSDARGNAESPGRAAQRELLCVTRNAAGRWQREWRLQ